QVKGNLRMGRIPFETNDLGRDRHLIVGIFNDRKLYLCPYTGQLSRQIDQRAGGADILRKPLFKNLFSCLVLPTDPDGKRDRVSCTVSAVLHMASSEYLLMRLRNRQRSAKSPTNMELESIKTEKNCHP